MHHTTRIEPVPNRGWDPRIHVYRNDDLVQVFVIETARFVVIVDTLINPATATALLEAVAAYQAGRQLLVVNTHADYDHAWGNQLFAGPGATAPAPIFAHCRCAVEFAHPDTLAQLADFRAAEPEIFDPVVLTPPTVLFDGELEIAGGDLTLRLLPAFGHTPDHIAIHIPEIATVLVGDAAELPFPAARAVDGLPQMRASLARLAALRPRTALYCHAPAAIGPFLLHANIAYFDAVEAACRCARTANPALDPAALADPVAAVACAYADVTPRGDGWDDVSSAYREAGHAAQIRMMLSWLAMESA